MGLQINPGCFLGFGTFSQKHGLDFIDSESILFIFRTPYKVNF